MNDPILKLAVWTVGAHAIRNILPTLDDLDGIVLSGLCSRNERILFEQAKAYQCEVFENPQQMLEDKETQAIYISSPNSLHFEQIKKCLLHGKHVIVEKSAVMSVAEANALIDIARERKLVLMEAFMYRFHSQFGNLKSLVSNQEYGRVLSIEASFGFPHLSKADIRYQAELGGGALNDAGAYTLSSIQYLLGSNLNVKSSHVLQEEIFEVDTSGSAMLINESADIFANCKWAFGGSYINEIRVWFEGAHVLVDRAFSKTGELESAIVVSNNGQVIDTINTGKDNHFLKMFVRFSQIINEGGCEEEYLNLYRQAVILEKIRLAH